MNSKSYQEENETMQKIGLDFGTTNSILSYMDGSTLTCYQMQNAGNLAYIPSYVCYNRHDQSVDIGGAAKSLLTDEDYQVFTAFKMLIAEKESKKLSRYGYTDKSPRDCAKSYIERLIQTYCKENNVQRLQSVVVTAPDIWTKEHRHAAREQLRAICDELGLPMKKILSEPVAASVYFAYRYKETHKTFFNGHAMVCDYGGGTLDLSLAQLEGEKITILERTGRGYDENTLGKAGVAFDETVISSAYQRHHNKTIKTNDPAFLELMSEFENKKIFLKESKIDPSLKRFLKEETLDSVIFKLDGMTFKASDMASAFDNAIKPDLLKALTEMRGYFKRHNVNPDNEDCFRVVMAGGFSGFYLVDNTVKQFFNSFADDMDKRFSSCFTVNDRAFAIAKGAALVANDVFGVEATCPISLGLRVRTTAKESIVDDKLTDMAILKQGVKLSNYHEPRFLSPPVDFFGNRKSKLILFIGDPPNRKYIALEHHAENLLPNINEPNNRWRIDFTVTDDSLFTFHAKDAAGKVKSAHLGDLLDKVSGLYMSKEEL
jgi:molecular chaperone DnaK